MKKLIINLLILGLISCVTVKSPSYADYQNISMMRLLDSIDSHPELFYVTVNCPDTSLHGKLTPFSHRFEGFERRGVDSLGRQQVLLYNRVYLSKYSYVVDNQWKGEDFDMNTLDSSKVKSITILTNRAGVWISHTGSEYLIIITTKQQNKPEK